jgi:hypothetical protein
MMFHTTHTTRFIDAGDLAAYGDAAQAASSARAAQTEIELMRCDIERLLMIAEALWGILKEQHGYPEAELVNRVMEIDRRDGKLDGRVAAAPPPSCPKCGRTLERKRAVCIYCGQLIARDPFER